jgi:hypothetical protein
MLEAMARIAPPQPNETMARIAFHLVPHPNGKQKICWSPARFFWCGFKIRKSPLLVGFFCALADS